MSREQDRLREMLNAYQKLVNRADDALEYRKKEISREQFQEWLKELTDELVSVEARYASSKTTKEGVA